jgi:3-oxoacyl-[acyl-carrier protein] reductase
MGSPSNLELILSGKICFVTGSTRGIGWATAETLSRYGATVILNGRTPSELLEERRRTLQERLGQPVLALAGDVGDPADVEACYAQIFKEYKRLDVLVNNAGTMQDALLGMISKDLIQSVINTNVTGAILHLQAAARLMARARSGSIINLTSIIGRMGKEGQTVYASSKAALIGMTLAAAKELAPKGIRVNAIAPGMIDTEMTRQLPPDRHAAAVNSIKLGRIGRPEEVAQAVLFFASDLSSYVTGQVLGVDGGMVL